MYVGNRTANTVSVIDAATGTITATIPNFRDPLGVAVTPDGTAAYVANAIGRTVSVISTATSTVTATISGLTAPFGIAAFTIPGQTGVANASGLWTLPGGTVATFAMSAVRVTAGGPIIGGLTYLDHTGQVRVTVSRFTGLGFSGPRTATASGAGQCTISGTTSSCPVRVTVTGGGPGTATFTLSYGTTTVPGTLLLGTATVVPAPPGPAPWP